MKEMSLAAFLTELVVIGHEVKKAHHTALEHAARVVEKEAKAEIGHYQEAAGPFAGWAELADRTKDDRVRQGYSENEPGLREGDMRDGIEHKVEMTTDTSGKAYVGSNDDKMVFFEEGSKNQPPRSALGGSAFRKEEMVRKICGEHVVAALTGKEVGGGGLPLIGPTG